jgi:transposase
MTDLCREFGISRETGCKIFNRYQEEGIAALTDRSKAWTSRSRRKPPGRPA